MTTPRHIAELLARGKSARDKIDRQRALAVQAAEQLHAAANPAASAVAELTAAVAAEQEHTGGG